MEDKRTRLSDKEKFEILLASKRPGFNKEEVMKKYGISKSAFYNIIKQKLDPVNSPQKGAKTHRDLSADRSELEVRLVIQMRPL